MHRSGVCTVEARYSGARSLLLKQHTMAARRPHFVAAHSAFIIKTYSLQCSPCAAQHAIAQAGLDVMTITFFRQTFTERFLGSR
jgi:hypothetical protein